MTDSKKGKRAAKYPTKGQLNKLIDDLLHPLFKRNKEFIIVDGVLHGLVEQNPPLSIQKFVKYNLPELVKKKGSRQRMRGGRKRKYACKLSVNGRFMMCKHKRAGPACLETGVFRTKCSKLKISYR